MEIASALRFPNPLPTTFGGRFSMIVSLLVQTIAMRYVRTRREPIAALVIPYLLRTAKRLARLIEAVANGTLPQPRPSRPRAASGRRAGATPIALPTTYGWLLRDLRHEAAIWRHYLERLLDEPEAKALLAAAPTAGRLLRPLCRMLALKHAILAKPKPQPKPKPPRPKPVPAEPPPRALSTAPDWQPRPIRTIDDLPCPRLATRWPFRDVLAKNRT